LKAGCLCALVLSPLPVAACQDDAAAKYDTIPAPGFVAVVAEITALTIRDMEPGGSCLDIDYRSEEVLFGAVGATFRAEMCSPDEAFTLADLDASASDIGFVTGATVLVGLLPSGNGGLRLAVPDCWGPFQVRLDEMGDPERKEFVTNIRDLLVEAEAEVLP
jgi:hypothetical protein